MSCFPLVTRSHSVSSSFPYTTLFRSTGVAARDAARRRFGNVTSHKEETRRMSGLGFFDLLSQDLRFALKSFLRTDRKSTRLKSSHLVISYALFCLNIKKYKNHIVHYN